jgi:pyruvate dehydrogenase E1 component beta subunit
MAEQMVTYAEAINQAFKEEMRRDKSVVMWGVDIISTEGSTTTRGIFEEFGEDRIIDTPILEEAIVGMAVGAAFAGLRPIAHLMCAGFVALTCDALFLKLGNDYQEWGHPCPPVVIFTPIWLGLGYGSDHGLSPEAILIHSPGLKVVMPSTAYDAKGLLKSAIRDDSPVVFMPHMGLLFGKQSIPTEEYLIPLGKADVKREGKDITIIAYSAMIPKTLAAAEKLSEEGIDAEVIDPRCLVPLDVATIVTSVKKTGHLLIVHESMKRGGVAGEIAFRVTETAPELIKSLKTPVKRLASPNIASPHGTELPSQILPQIDDIVSTVKALM